mmetsp:Transcript_9203/g.13686  ORF Transcript_9203/g.13686 Transcript_9203/m.13686 type:complete len:415 (+) Transcript_9203:828-2072(+)
MAETITMTTFWEMVALGWIALALLGLSLVEAGIVRKHHSHHALFKNFIQIGLGVIVWWLVGYAFANGEVEKGFIGSEKFAGDDWHQTTNYHVASLWFLFGLVPVFALNAALGERLNLWAYLVYTVAILGFVFPVVAAWGLGNGWLTDMNGKFLDRAGANTVHLLTGSLCIPAVAITGSRIGKFSGEPTYPFHPFDIRYVVTGGFLLWLGLLGANSGAAATPIEVGQAMFNTILAGFACSLTCYVITHMIPGTGHHELWGAILVGGLAGMISISSTALNTGTVDAFFMGIIVAPFFVLGITLVEKLKLDDCGNSIAVFFLPGLLGTLYIGIFDNDEGVLHGGNGETLGLHAIGGLVVAVWGLTWSTLIFSVLRLTGLLRIDPEIEKHGFENVNVGLVGFYREVETSVQSSKPPNQ